MNHKAISVGLRIVSPGRDCYGAPSKPIEIFIRHAAIKDPAEWPAYIAETKKHPDAQDEARARAFARGVIEQIR